MFPQGKKKFLSTPSEQAWRPWPVILSLSRWVCENHRLSGTRISGTRSPIIRKYIYCTWTVNFVSILRIKMAAWRCGFKLTSSGSLNGEIIFHDVKNMVDGDMDSYHSIVDLFVLLYDKSESPQRWRRWHIFPRGTEPLLKLLFVMLRWWPRPNVLEQDCVVAWCDINKLFMLRKLNLWFQAQQNPLKTLTKILTSEFQSATLSSKKSAAIDTD